MKSWAVDNSNRLKKIIDKLSIEEGEYICRLIHRDPFKDIYPILMIIYAFILGGFLLWPFDFIFKVKNDARWIGYSKGIEFLGIGQAVSNSSTQEFFDRLVKGDGLTIEIWLETEDMNQSGPARILSYSINKDSCNFTLGQWRDKLVARFRTTKTTFRGTSPHLVIPDTFNYRSLKHMVIMYDFLEQRVYINGELKARSNVLKGDFSNWDPSSRLVIGNEDSSNRPWKGKIYYAAIFDRPLTEQEIQRNYLSGIRSKTDKGSRKHNGFKAKHPILRYLFNEGKEYVIHDSGLVSNPVNLFIPKYIRYKKEPFLIASIDSLQRKLRFSDLIINILIFIPLGVFTHGTLRTRYGLTLKISLAVLLAGTLFTISFESIQYFSMTRHSSVIDILMNMTGVGIGILMDRAYKLFLNYQAGRLQMFMHDRAG